jgi:hypothetical protein
MAGASDPQDGDVVIRQDTRNGKRVFVLHTAPGAEQFVFHTRDAAITQALPLRSVTACGSG